MVECKCILRMLLFSLLDQSSPAVVEEHAAHRLSRSPGDVPEQHLEVIIFPCYFPIHSIHSFVLFAACR